MMNYVGVSTTNAATSRFIRWLTGSTVSHSFLAFTAVGKTWILQAEWNGIIITPIDRFQAQNTIVLMVPIIELTDEHMAHSMESLGTPYDYTGLFGAAIPLIGRWFKKKWINPFNSSKALFCSEMVAGTLKEAGLLLSSVSPPDTTPEDIRAILTQYLLRKP